ncbi:MAG TPA: hypothetical protein VGT79_03580 [Xanthomonadaceae bacterium]|nr:hypothetical protein [Xanthomonadaceae bacterium]
MNIRWVTAVALACVIGTAMAEEVIPMRMLDKQQFATFDAQVRTDLQQGHRYKEISPEDQDILMKTLGRMEDRWQKADADGKLSASATVDNANDQEIVRTILNHAVVDSRLICDRETPMGTKIAKNVCRTVGQMRREQNDSQESLRQVQEQPQNVMPHH